MRGILYSLHAKPVWEVTHSETITIPDLQRSICCRLGERDSTSAAPVSLPVGSLLLPMFFISGNYLWIDLDLNLLSIYKGWFVCWSTEHYLSFTSLSFDILEFLLHFNPNSSAWKLCCFRDCKITVTVVIIRISNEKVTFSL